MIMITEKILKSNKEKTKCCQFSFFGLLDVTQASETAANNVNV